jgi:hypothetical protein
VSVAGTPAWRKSSYCANGQCVEVAVGARPADLTLLRDSKNPATPPVAFSSAAWDAFLVNARLGAYDVPTAHQ